MTYDTGLLAAFRSLENTCSQLLRPAVMLEFATTYGRLHSANKPNHARQAWAVERVSPFRVRNLHKPEFGTRWPLF